MNKARQNAYNLIDESFNSLWRAGVILRSVKPRAKDNEYVWLHPRHLKDANEKEPSLGGFISYEEFQAQLN